jgi:hypothetical protein
MAGGDASQMERVRSRKGNEEKKMSVTVLETATF